MAAFNMRLLLLLVFAWSCLSADTADRFSRRSAFVAATAPRHRTPRAPLAPQQTSDAERPAGLNSALPARFSKSKDCFLCPLFEQETFGDCPEQPLGFPFRTAVVHELGDDGQLLGTTEVYLYPQHIFLRRDSTQGWIALQPYLLSFPSKSLRRHEPRGTHWTPL